MVFDGRRVTRILGLLDGLERQTARGINAIVAMLGGKPQRPKPPRKRK
jgi:hypothetical protein